MHCVVEGRNGEVVVVGREARGGEGACMHICSVCVVHHECVKVRDCAPLSPSPPPYQRARLSYHEVVHCPGAGVYEYPVGEGRS